MNGDDTTPTPEPDAVTAHLDPDALKDAHGRTGRMLKSAGLPFEDDEFEDDADEIARGTGDGVDPKAAPADEG